MKYIILSIILSSCSYKFASVRQELPRGYRSISIEPVYDTSEKVLPHDVLWNTLQTRFARNGTLLLLPADQADLYLRTRIVSANIQQRRPKFTDKEQDPELRLSAPASPGEFNDLNIAGAYAREESQQMKVKIELWNLKSRQLLLSRSYSKNKIYQLIDSTAPSESLFIRSEEALENVFESNSNDIAGRVLKDVLSVVSKKDTL